jgi:hypothetical protein
LIPQEPRQLTEFCRMIDDFLARAAGHERKQAS